jgi:hypothetical protein
METDVHIIIIILIIIIITIITYAIALFNTETTINCIKTAAVCTWHRTTVWLFTHCYLSQHFYLLHADISYVIMKLQEYQSMIFVKLRNFNLIKLFWFSLQLLSETFLILRRTEKDIINANMCNSSCKVCVILVIFSWNFKFVYWVLTYTDYIFHENP